MENNAQAASLNAMMKYFEVQAQHDTPADIKGSVEGFQPLILYVARLSQESGSVITTEIIVRALFDRSKHIIRFFHAGL